MSSLRLTLLGGVQARLDSGAAILLPTRKAQALLAYLALPPGRAHPRDKLAALLWGETGDEQARGSLRQALAALRRALPAGVLVSKGETVALDPAAVEVDAGAFEAKVAAGTAEALDAAAALYGGDLLAGLAVKEAGFEEWLVGERERLRELALEGLAKLLAHQRRAGATDAAIQTGLKLLGLDPSQEPVHRALMRLYAQAGRRGAALRQYQACVGVLQRELGVEPEAETKVLYQEILRYRAAVQAPAPVSESCAVEPVQAETPLVQRDAETDRLRGLLQEAAGGRGRLVVVLGEAGIGKTRLVAELAAEASRRGARVLVGRSYESEQILAFGPWVGALRAAGSTAAAEAVQGLEPVWRAEVARLLPELGIQPPAAPPDHRTLFEAIGRLVRGLAAPSPLLLVLEDLHWADEMSCRLLAFVGRRLGDWPVLLVATAREEELPEAPALRGALEDLERERTLEKLGLGPLSRTGTVELVRTRTRVGSDPQALDRLGEQVWAVSEGNPLMAVETLRAWREGERAVPARVREVVTRRLDRLGERAQQVASVAAVIGRDCEFPLLLAAAGLSEEETAQGVEELVRRRVLHGVGERFAFTHDRVRETAYERILGPRRRLLHRKVAEAIEALHADHLQDCALALGLHYREAELWDPAARHLGHAGAAARERAANREAVACFDAALECLGRLPEDRDRSERVVDAILGQETALMGLGEFQRSLEQLREGEALARGLGDRLRLGRVLGRFAYNLGSIGDLDAANENAEQARAIAVEVGDARSHVSSNVVLARARYACGDYRGAMEAVRENDAFARGQVPGGPVRANVSFSRVWGVLALAELGEFAEAVARGDEALRVSAAEFGRHGEAWAHLGVGRLHLVKGDFARAIEVLERGLPLCEAGGDLAVYFSRTATSLGGAYALSGRLAEAVPLLERADRHAESLGFAYDHAVVIATLAEARLLMGDVESASRVADRALALTRQHGQRGWEAWTLRVLGEITRDPVHYRAALALAVELGMRPLEAHCYLGLARVTGDRAARAAALDLYRALDMPFWLARAEAGTP